MNERNEEKKTVSQLQNCTKVRIGAQKIEKLARKNLALEAKKCCQKIKLKKIPVSRRVGKKFKIWRALSKVN